MADEIDTDIESLSGVAGGLPADPNVGFSTNQGLLGNANQHGQAAPPDVDEGPNNGGDPFEGLQENPTHVPLNDGNDDDEYEVVDMHDSDVDDEPLEDLPDLIQNPVHVPLNGEDLDQDDIQGHGGSFASTADTEGSNAGDESFDSGE